MSRKFSPTGLRVCDAVPQSYRIIGQPHMETDAAVKFEYGLYFIWIPKIAARELTNGVYCAADWAIKSGMKHTSAEERQP